VSDKGGYQSKFLWTVGTFGLSAVLKFASSIILSWLLAPSILGVVVVVNTVRLGVEILTDIGVEQNIVHHRDGLEPYFRNTAWTIQVVRGLILTLVFAAAAPWLAHVYGIDTSLFLVAALTPAIGGLHSIATLALVKGVAVRRRNLFELTCEMLALLTQIGLALWLRSVWAPVLGLVVATAIRTGLSYTLPDPWQRFGFDREVAMRMLRFGRWIMITSLVMYAAMSLDRLYLGRVAPLALLGIYGIARNIAELPTTLSRRMSYQIIFPALARAAEGDRAGQMRAIAGSRLTVILIGCGGLAAAAGVADRLVAFVYDPRYAAAGWMLSVLLLGGVFAVLSNLNEALLLSAGRPGYSSVANTTRLATLAVLLPGGYALAGMSGAVAAVALTEAAQYGYIGLGLRRVGLHFWRQDAAAIALAAIVFAAILLGRMALGWGNPLAGWGPFA